MPAESVVNKDEAELLDVVLGIWREVLVTAPRLEADSNFFLGGGDSLDLARVLVRIRERLGTALDPRDVASFSTPRRMARRCARAGAVRAVSPPARAPAVAADGAGVPPSYPCSAGQGALWLAEQLGDGCGLYNTAVALHYSGALQVPALARALGSLLQRHEVLRSRLWLDPHARQLVACIDDVPDVVLTPHAVPEGCMRQRMLAAATQPFDLERGPPWRFQLFASGGDSGALLLCLHHTVTDGWSGSVLLRHLAAAYNALLLDPAWQAQSRDCEFRHWCLQQALPAAADLRWWRACLGGADRLRSWPPTGEARWPFAMACEQLVLAADLAERIRQAMAALGLPPSALFLAAFRLALAQLGGCGELCIGVPVNLRETSTQDEAVGYFVNLLVTRAAVAADMERHAALRCVHASLATALQHRTVPFAELARALRPALLPSGNAWCDVLFAFQNLPAAEPEFSGLRTRVEALPLPQGQHPLKLEILCQPARYVCRLEYARKCLGATEARALLAVLHGHIEALAACARSS